MEDKSETTSSPSTSAAQQSVPNATAALVLGILGLVLNCCYGAGFLLSLIGLILGVKGKKLYKANPEQYSKKSYSNLNAGYICSLIGVILAGLGILFWIVYVVIFAGSMAWAESLDPSYYY